MSDNQIFPPSLALQALRYGPYQNAAYALSELIDNSADAGAREICVVIFVGDHANSSRPHKIVVLDDGCGMNQDTLMRCIQYGYGKAAEPEPSTTVRRLGKFGVGLVAASCTQCSALQVLSWQKGEVKLGHSPSIRLELSEENERVKENRLPDIDRKQLPEWTQTVFEGMSKGIAEMTNGTLVLWDELIRSNRSWARAVTWQSNLLDLCGRIHREFIQMGRLTITVNIFDETTGKIESSKVARPIDPTFLTNWDTTDLADYGFRGNKTLFTPYTGHTGDSGKNFDGAYEPELANINDPNSGQTLGSYLLTASYRSDDVVNDEGLNKKYKDPGDAPYGKLANRLKGVSIMRAGRELSLDDRWLRVSKTVDRWLSVSIDFDTSLDELFGVSNDKQQARNLNAHAGRSIEDIKEEIQKLEEDEGNGSWEQVACLEVARHIKDKLQKMQREVERQRRGQRKGGSKEALSDPFRAPVHELIEQSKVLPKGGKPIPSDSVSPSSDPEGTKKIYSGLKSGSENAENVRPSEVMEYKLKIDYATNPSGLPTRMFGVVSGPGHILVEFHEQHPLSDVMSKLLVSSSEDDDEEDAPTMQDALRVIRGLIASFARIQIEAVEHDGDQAAKLENCLVTWSNKAAHVFGNKDD